MKTKAEFFEYQEPLAVRLAYEIVDMDRELRRLREENEDLKEYRRKYNEELNRGIKHSQDMVAGLLELALTPGVLEATSEHNRKKKKTE